KGLFAGNLVEVPQAPSDDERQTGLKHAPKIFTETCKLDWNKPVDEVYNLIRGLAPYPAAFTFLKDKKLKIYRAEKINEIPTGDVGKFTTDNKTWLHIGCRNGYISILELQLEGKKKMDIAAFLRGYHFDSASV
ncbi:MAG: methionyl-tRNA formyltransferase, partial [Ferruginibacter sp.]